MGSKGVENSPIQDADATRRVQELLERGHALGIAIDSNYYITGGGGTLDVSFRAKLAGWRGRFSHLIPSIWEREIKRHLRTRIERAREKALSMSERDIYILKSAEAHSGLKAFRVAVEAVDVAETANTLWEEFIVETHAIKVDPPPNSATEVLDWYFSQHLPFEGAGDKKHEFPDAFALHSLSAFAASNGLQVVVVITKDSGAYGHCANTERLLAFHDVQSALGAFDAKALIDRRRQLSEEASKTMRGDRLERLVGRLVKYINRPYEHEQQSWPAITKPSFPQNPRILINDVLHHELIPFGNFGLPVSVTSIFTGSDDKPDETVSGVVSRIKLRIKATVSCEISAIDVSDQTSNSLRQKFPLDAAVEAELTIDFASQFPFSDGDESEVIFAMIQFGSPAHGIMRVEVDPLHVAVPDQFEFRGFA